MSRRTTPHLWLALLPVLLALFWLPLRTGGIDPLPLRTVQVAGLAAASLILLAGFRVLAVDQRAIGVSVAMGVLVIAAGISTALSADLDASVPLLINWIWLGSVALLCFFFARDPKRWRLLWGTLAAAGTVQAAWSFFVWWGGGEPGATQSGTFYAPNQFAGYLLLLGPLLVAAALATQSRSEAAAWGFAAEMIFLAVLLSGSRAGIVASMVGFAAVVLFLIRANFKQTVLRAALLLFGFAIAGWFLSSNVLFSQSVNSDVSTPDVTSGIREGGTGTLYHRIHWAQGAALIASRNPIAGQGLGTFGDMFVQVQDPRWAWSRYAHNHYMEALAEGGLPLFVGTLLLPLTSLHRLPDPSNADYWRRVGLWAGIASGSAHLLLDYDWAFPAYAVTFVCSCVLLVSIPTGNVERRRFGVPSLVVAVVMITTGIVAGSGVIASRQIQSSSARDEQVLRTVILLTPYSTGPRQLLALVLIQQGDRASLEEARSLLSGATFIDELNPHLLWALAEVELKLGREGSARQALRRAIKVAPNAPRSYELASRFESSSGNRLEAAQILDEGIERLLKRPDQGRLASSIAQLLILRAGEELALSGPDAALRYAIQATDIAPRSTLAWITRTQIACSLEDFESTRKGAESVKQLSPDVRLEDIVSEKCLKRR